MADFYDDPGGLVIQEAEPIVSGSGVYNTFLAIDRQGTSPTEDGFNLNQNGGFLGAGNGTHTHTLQLSGLGSDETDTYFVFRLDINEPNAPDGDVILTDLQFWTGGAATTANWDGTTLTGLTLNYALTGPVVLNDHSHGSGTDDYVILVPKSYFDGVDPASYLTVYAKFTGADGGFEEFRSAPGGDDVVNPGGAYGIAIVKDTLAFGSSVEGETVLVGTALTWTYAVTNAGEAPIVNTMLEVADDHNLAITYVSGDVGNDGILSVGETWLYTATGFADVGQYNNIGTVTVTPDPSLPPVVDDFDPSSYFGAYTGITIDKVTTGKDSAGVTHTGDGISVVTGSAVTWTYTLTNTGNEELSNVTVVDDMGTVSAADDKTLTWANLFSGDTDGDHNLDTTEIWTFKLGGIAQSGNYLNTATASGSFTDDTQHTSTATDTDTSGYTGSFTQSKAGLTIGYWYNHLAVSKNDPTAPYADKFLTWAPNDPNHSGQKGLLLGDTNHNGVVNADETTLWVPRDALAQLINASQTATDTRQILMSQAIATQLNIDNGTGDPGYQGTAGADLITEAVKWLRGITPYVFAGSTGSVEGLQGSVGNNGILTSGAGATFEYNLTTKSFSGDANLSQSGIQVLTSNLTAWQTAVTYDAFDYDHIPKPAPGDTTADFWANGEGLKNALQAVNQNHLVVDTSGQVVAWDESASATGPYTELHLNGPNDFWAVLSNEYPTHTALLKGIWA